LELLLFPETVLEFRVELLSVAFLMDPQRFRHPLGSEEEVDELPPMAEVEL
jgi:hypothetical protein